MERTRDDKESHGERFARRFASNPAISRKLFAKKARFIARFQTWKRAYSGSTIFDVSSVLYPRETLRKPSGGTKREGGSSRCAKLNRKAAEAKDSVSLSLSLFLFLSSCSSSSSSTKQNSEKRSRRNEGTERILINAGLRERERRRYCRGWLR